MYKKNGIRVSVLSPPLTRARSQSLYSYANKKQCSIYKFNCLYKKHLFQRRKTWRDGLCVVEKTLGFLVVKLYEMDAYGQYCDAYIDKIKIPIQSLNKITGKMFEMREHLVELSSIHVNTNKSINQQLPVLPIKRRISLRNTSKNPLKNKPTIITEKIGIDEYIKLASNVTVNTQHVNSQIDIDSTSKHTINNSFRRDPIDTVHQDGIIYESEIICYDCVLRSNTSYDTANKCIRGISPYRCNKLNEHSSPVSNGIKSKSITSDLRKRITTITTDDPGNNNLFGLANIVKPMDKESKKSIYELYTGRTSFKSSDNSSKSSKDSSNENNFREMSEDLMEQISILITKMNNARCEFTQAYRNNLLYQARATTNAAILKLKECIRVIQVE
ncbi:hypothetical protein BMR1_02g02590 [Babesia microti strain RI]|uniref:DUF2439 domain-containing protein n=1 Tax=Babesia microti (strain RI) TaxID=1133968 RepID=I7I8U0_BABMR|nr:hypothetical protein BMR1_02g02590 [Babesia microti strain RI]CCF73673.1 hypothetical protein BMR1_02g02590 [Babesia microti strain RI]|eukprot:XP_012648282.1 hypothetical protein BMR1_02g02590 [Babesia microti strain RI]